MSLWGETNGNAGGDAMGMCDLPEERGNIDPSAMNATALR
jgi:hypothetical protein